jgi:hypothetical protein
MLIYNNGTRGGIKMNLDKFYNDAYFNHLIDNGYSELEAKILINKMLKSKKYF